MDRKAKAVWQGDIKNGRGELSSDSGILNNTPYSFSTRFGEQKGTNPEELIAAAHAGCFTMALSGALGKQGVTATRLETSATVTIAKEGEGFKITSSRLKLRAQVPGIDEATFRKIADEAKASCPISRVLNAEISLETEFQPSTQSSASAH
ncbi:MAG: OsmC family protein [Bdellovibrio sp.]